MLNYKKILIVFLVLLILVSLCYFLRITQGIKNFFFKILAPIQKVFWRVGRGVANFTESVFGGKSLKKEAERLRFENQKLLDRLADLVELKEENRVLRDVLDLGLESELEFMLARVSGKDALQDTLLINRGAKDGVLAGLSVVTEQKVLVGRIGMVYDNFSEVVLISHKDSSFGAKVLEKDTEGVIKGRGGFRLELDLVPREKDLAEEDIVITSVLGGVYPVGLLVGEVGKVKKQDLDSFQSATVDIIFEINSLDYLLIVTNY